MPTEGQNRASRYIDPQVQELMGQLTATQQAQDPGAAALGRSIVDVDSLGPREATALRTLESNAAKDYAGDYNTSMSDLSAQIKQLQGFEIPYASALEGELNAKDALRDMKLDAIKARHGMAIKRLNQESSQFGRQHELDLQTAENEKLLGLDDVAAAKKTRKEELAAVRDNRVDEMTPTWIKAGKSKMGAIDPDLYDIVANDYILADMAEGVPLNEIIKDLNNMKYIELEGGERVEFPKGTMQARYFADILRSYEGPGRKQKWRPGMKKSAYMTEEFLNRPQEQNTRGQDLAKRFMPDFKEDSQSAQKREIVKRLALGGEPQNQEEMLIWSELRRGGLDNLAPPGVFPWEQDRLGRQGTQGISSTDVDVLRQYWESAGGGGGGAR
jgi:hypothetical protein